MKRLVGAELTLPDFGVSVGVIGVPDFGLISSIVGACQNHLSELIAVVELRTDSVPSLIVSLPALAYIEFSRNNSRTQILLVCHDDCPLLGRSDRN